MYDASLLDMQILKKVSVFDPHTKKIYVTQDVSFHEEVPFFGGSKCSLQGENLLNFGEDSIRNLENLGNQILDE